MSTKKTKTIRLRISADVYAQIQALCTKKGIPITLFLNNAAAHHLRRQQKKKIEVSLF